MKFFEDNARRQMKSHYFSVLIHDFPANNYKFQPPPVSKYVFLSVPRFIFVPADWLAQQEQGGSCVEKFHFAEFHSNFNVE